MEARVDLNETTTDMTTVRFINQVINDSINKKASDIHFEPYETFYRIRIRIDGILYELTQTDIKLAARITSRLKIMAELNIAEKRLPQDGRFNFTFAGKTLHLRINSCPTLFGEKIVLRILKSNHEMLALEDLGLDKEQYHHFTQAIHKSQGLILVTGPTGSGKTITLYTALNLLNNIEKNISTVEDPVEIYFSGINQVNVNHKTGLNFATVMRAFLRQDPDIIMLGEIRDTETADISIKAAQTGHLVFATLHTNNTTEALTRLYNMGIAEFNLLSSLNLIIAQRLIRRLCPHCKEYVKLDSNTLLKQGFTQAELPNLKIFKAIGCKKCTLGYQGRIALFELLPVAQSSHIVITENPNLSSLQRQQQGKKIRTLHDAGLDKIRQGITSLEEINRIVN